MKIYQAVLRYQKKGLLNEKSLKAVYSQNTPQEDITELEELYDIIKNNEEIGEENFVSTTEEYSFLKLTSGRYCLCKTILAEEYKEKFLCHALILDEGYFPFYPSELINSPIFLNDNSDKENIVLSTLDNIPISGEYAFRVVSEFIKEHSFKYIREILKAVVDFKQEQQNIVVIQRSKDIKLVIAAVHMAFPIQNAHNITFSTIKLNCQDNRVIMNCFGDLQAISPELAKNSRIYNMKIGMIPQVFKDYKFIKVVETGYLVSGQILTAFHKYLSQFDYKEVDSRNEDAYNLFIMLNSTSEVFTSAQIEKVFDFVLRNSNKDILEYIFEKLEPTINNIVKMADYEGIKLIIDFVFKVSIKSDKPIFMQTAISISFNIIDYIVMDRKDIKNAYELYDSLREKVKDNPHVLLRYSITQDRINYINNLLNHEPECEKALFYIDIVLKSLVELGYTWPQVIGIENIVIFFDTCISQISEQSMDISNILKTASLNVDIFSHIILLNFNRIQSDVDIKSFAVLYTEIVNKIEPEIVIEIRKKINELGGGKLLFEEYKISIDKVLSDDIEEEDLPPCEGDEDISDTNLQIQQDNGPSLDEGKQESLINYFNEYFKSVFLVIYDYYKNYFSEALKIYISKLKNNYKYSECARLINELSNNGIIADDEAVAYLVKGFEEGVKLDLIDSELEKMFTRVKKLKKTRNITSSPDITAMVDFVFWLKQNINVEYTIDEVLNEHVDIDKLDDYNYHKYLNWCLPEVLIFSKTAEDHKKIIHYFQRDDEQDFFDEYLNIVINLISSNKEKGMKVLQGFVVYFFFYLEPSYKIIGEEGIVEKVRKSIIDIFKSNPRSFLKEFDYLIKKEFSDRGLSMPIQWSQIVNEISSTPQGGILNKLSKIFKR